MRAAIQAVTSCALLLSGAAAHAEDGDLGASADPAVLAANETFYRAFRGGDLPAMEALWGHVEPIIMDHPRGERFDGRSAVMEYWQWALPGSSPEIECEVSGVIRQGDTVTVYCDELLFQGSLEMKNIFHMENGKWKMIYHGPLQQQGVS